MRYINAKMDVQHDPLSVMCATELTAEFLRLTELRWQLPPDLNTALQSLFDALGPESLRPPEDRQCELYATINAKLKLGQPSFKRVLDTAAEHNIFFNYHQKAGIQRAVDYNDRAALFEILLRSPALPKALSEIAQQFQSPTWEETRQALKTVLAEDARSHQVQRAIFSAYAFLCFQTPLIHTHFAGDKPDTYLPGFYDHLRRRIPRAFDRPCGLVYLRIDDHWLEGLTSEQQIRTKVLSSVQELSQRLSNHCYLAILLKPLGDGEAMKWKLFSDLVLYAEKHRTVRLQKGYFQSSKIASKTQDYIPDLNADACRFDLAHEGLFYKDCFVTTYQFPSVKPHPQSEPDLLLLFEKNERDETPIPCPACRSFDVQGNSYPVLGVRSWECNNLICPERSKYDRGKRYSLYSLIRQEAITEEEAVIPLSSLRLWKRDVVVLDSETAVLQMLVQHYSLLQDHVLVVNSAIPHPQFLGRTLIGSTLDACVNTRQEVTGNADVDDIGTFFRGPYFQRICVDRQKRAHVPWRNLSELKGVEVYCGDCFEVLQQIGDATVDGIVTSPPYYNAREYAQWPNIYCFLYDQYNVARELYRVLKPGGLFLYNIFDYFDNENNVVFSAMGKKRMILGAYAINLFQRIGFRIVRNVIWDKGEIEGKRNFNQGNRSPYYQAPFNCWEHILIFCKGDIPKASENLPYVLRAQPVVKMIGGRNILGHTAPFPEAIPKLLLDLLEPRSRVLDPFAGSMTTARAAYKRGLRSVSIDFKEEYCRLGLNLLIENDMNLLTDISQV